MIDKIKHALTCWVTLDNTKVINENYFWYMIVECISCEKQYFVFRINWQATLEPLNKDNLVYFEERIKYIEDFLLTKDNLSKFLIFKTSNLEKIIDYPMWNEQIFLEEVIDKETWKIIAKNVSFNDLDLTDYINKI